MASQDIDYMTSLGLNTAYSEKKLFYYHRGLQDASTPIFILIHGYPQTNFMWRHIVSRLPKDIPLFIPDIPGYGRSVPLSEAHSKLNQGAAILSALSEILPSKDKHSIILVGHDRGARICHRLAVDNTPVSHLPILGVVLLDIVPTLAAWPSGDARASTGGFHWPFLANVEIATKMILALGGDVWMKTLLYRWAGKSKIGLAKLEEHGAVDVYANSFKNESVIRATCDDYRAGAEEDVDLQKEDQEKGRKIDLDVLVMFSQEYLGKRHEMRKIWEQWMKDGSERRLEVLLVGEGVGHFLAEEAEEEVSEALLACYKKLAR